MLNNDDFGVGYDSDKIYYSKLVAPVKDYRKKFVGIDCDTISFKINEIGLRAFINGGYLPTKYGTIITVKELFSDDNCELIALYDKRKKLESKESFAEKKKWKDGHGVDCDDIAGKINTMGLQGFVDAGHMPKILFSGSSSAVTITAIKLFEICKLVEK